MNFIFFMPDELRAESVGCYGHPLAPTPRLDRLAAEGARFDQCHAQHPVCSPARCSFMTGWYPHVRGHRTLWHLLRPDEPNLLQYLNSYSYTSTFVPPFPDQRDGQCRDIRTTRISAHFSKCNCRS